jgi:hypothetical protein
VSHFTKTDLPIQMKDREVIIKAAQKLGCAVLENAIARGWAGQEHSGELVLRHPESPYDVALNRNKEGAYEPTADLYQGHVARIFGTSRENPYGKLIARYGAEKAKKLARVLGYAVHETVDPRTGTITQKVVIPT